MPDKLHAGSLLKSRPQEQADKKAGKARKPQLVAQTNFPGK
jgi:hypothetical protein